MDQWYCKVSGEAGPRVPHKTLAKAYTEARRLFDLHGRTRRVYVLEVIGTIEPEADQPQTMVRDSRTPDGPRV